MDDHIITIKNLTLTCAPAIVWVKDANRILLVDHQRELFWALEGIEATLWDWLAMAYPYEKIIHFLALTLDKSSEEADRQLRSVLDVWRQSGIIQVEGEEQCD